MKQIREDTHATLLAGLIVGTMLSAASVGFAAEGEWVRKADMPTPRFGSSIAEVDGKLFVIGGSQSDDRLATVEVYDPAADNWTPRADMPTARKNTAAAVVNGIIYVFGGTDSIECACLTTTEAYDPNSNVWTTKHAMPTSRYGLAAVPINGKIYVIGGWVGGAMTSAVEVYDPVTDTWEDKAPLPRASGHFGAAGFNGKIYVFGGADVDNVIRDTREYDPVTDRWTTKAAMPTGRAFPSATMVDGKIYVLGGNLLGSWPVFPVTRQVDVYDPVTNTWEPGVPMPTAKSGLVAATVKGKLYAIGGHTGVSPVVPAGTVYATVEELSLPAAPAPPLTIQRSVLLSWKQSATDYVVEGASSAEGPWAEVTEFESQMVGGEVHMTVIQTGEARFFRLSVQ